jgi:hypothetical protein
MSIEARIQFNLSAAGRRDSLRSGGNGARAQEMTGPIDPEQLDAFDVDEQGRVFFDATKTPTEVIVEQWNVVVAVRGQKEIHAQADAEVEWNVVPAWVDLVGLAQCLKQWADGLDNQYVLEMESQARHETEVEQMFLSDPHARADKLSEDYVEIAGCTFWNTNVVREAHARAAKDLEEQRQANRATLTRWIQEHGSENQKQRLAAGLLPWAEAHSELEKGLFALLDEFPLYERFNVDEVCICPQMGGESCGLKFQSVDATELTADEWVRFDAIRTSIPDAQFQLREHRAKCRTRTEAEIRRGVIVKRSVDRLTVKREYALGTVR